MECDVGGVVELVRDAAAEKAKKSKKLPNAGSSAGGGSVPKSVDAAVQHTNDDSVVSKRSAVYHGYFDDVYIRHFVKKFSRRSPLINRGYYLRMLAITDVVERCMRYVQQGPCAPSPSPSPSPSPAVQVVSLGAGFDTLAFRLYNAPMYAEVHYFDVDYPAVIANKIALMRAAPPTSFPFASESTPMVVRTKAEKPQLHVGRYHAIGLDLRDSQQMLTALLREGFPHFDPTAPTVFYAECVMQYMSPEESSDLVRFIASDFPHACFIAYDQVNPNDSFGKVMQGSLKAKNSPLLGIAAFPDGAALSMRALQCGMARVSFADFFALSSHYLSGAERERVEAIECFDEYEEWREMCDHYGILVASTAHAPEVEWPPHPSFTCYPRVEPAAMPPPDRTAARSVFWSSLDVRLDAWPTGRFAFEGWGSGGFHVESRTGSAASACNPTSGESQKYVVTIGGFLASRKHQRTNAVHVHGLRDGELTLSTAITSSMPPPPLVSHSFTRLAPLVYLVFGGRTNPTGALDGSYLLHVSLPRCHSALDALDSTACLAPDVAVTQWATLNPTAAGGNLTDVPCPRFRHAMVRIPTSGLPVPQGCQCERHSVLLFGGIDGSGHVLGDCWVATICARVCEVCALCGRGPQPSIQWRRLPLVAVQPQSTPPDTEISTPPALASAAVLALADGRVLLSGGLMAGGRSCGLMWVIDAVTGTCTLLPPEKAAMSPRFSHSMCHLRGVSSGGVQESGILILGGCGDAPKTSFTAAYVLTGLGPGGSETSASLVPLALPDGVDVPTWTRSECVPLADGVVGILGGGFTCFSFGTCAHKPALLLLGDAAQAHLATLFRDSRASAAPRAPQRGPARGEIKSGDSLVAPEPSSLMFPRPTLPAVAYGDAMFTNVVTKLLQPTLFRGTPLGPCVERWRCPTYLKEAEGTTLVSVHVAPPATEKLDFVKKNFKFRHVAFADLVDHCVAANACHQRAKGCGVGREAPMMEVSAAPETWYFRSVGTNMKSEKSNLWRDFGTIGSDFTLPAGAWRHIEPRMHQSCLRINAPPLQMWTHYDTLDNVLCQIVGRKRVLLFPPSEYNNLYIVNSSSRALDMDYPDLHRFPRLAQALQNAIEVVLVPGDMLFIPSLWFHHISSELNSAEGADVGADAPLTVSVNVFFERFARDDYDKKDLYGNKDLPACVQLRSDIVNFVKERIFPNATGAKDGHLSQGGVRQASSGEPVPSDFVEFALRQAIQDLEGVADELAASRYRAV